MPKLSPDSGLPLQPIQYRGVTLDVCPQTGGIWFDRGELGKLRRMDYECLEGLDHLVKSGEQPASIQPGQRKCPNDGSQLFPYCFGENKQVELDECRECGGIWCDHVELDKIAAHVARENPDYVPPNLTPEAQNALAAIGEDHAKFMAKANAITAFATFMDHRPFWLRGFAQMGVDEDEGKPWL